MALAIEIEDTLQDKTNSMTMISINIIMQMTNKYGRSTNHLNKLVKTRADMRNADPTIIIEAVFSITNNITLFPATRISPIGSVCHIDFYKWY